MKQPHRDGGKPFKFSLNGNTGRSLCGWTSKADAWREKKPPRIGMRGKRLG